MARTFKPTSILVSPAEKALLDAIAERERCATRPEVLRRLVRTYEEHHKVKIVQKGKMGLAGFEPATAESFNPTRKVSDLSGVDFLNGSFSHNAGVGAVVVGTAHHAQLLAPHKASA